jgi:hypothetical protein
VHSHDQRAAAPARMSAHLHTREPTLAKLKQLPVHLADLDIERTVSNWLTIELDSPLLK